MRDCTFLRFRTLAEPDQLGGRRVAGNGFDAIPTNLDGFADSNAVNQFSPNRRDEFAKFTRFLTRLVLKNLHPGLEAVGEQLLEDYNFDGIEPVVPTTLFDGRYELNLDGREVHLIYVGPCHRVGDTIIQVPGERVVFAGDVLFRQCTPVGWTGSYEKWFKCLDLLIELNPGVIVPGHGPLCGIEGVKEMKAYLQYVRDESRKCFDAGIPSLEAAKKIEFGPYSEWRAPARLYMNVERAYREFRNEPPDASWDSAATFDAIYQVAKVKGIEAEF
jgi:glyoxylase-like metal-dependent hydrolase (beta-lactamase superfamily II)